MVNFSVMMHHRIWSTEKQIFNIVGNKLSNNSSLLLRKTNSENSSQDLHPLGLSRKYQATHPSSQARCSWSLKVNGVSELLIPTPNVACWGLPSWYRLHGTTGSGVSWLLQDLRQISTPYPGPVCSPCPKYDTEEWSYQCLHRACSFPVNNKCAYLELGWSR